MNYIDKLRQQADKINESKKDFRKNLILDQIMEKKIPFIKSHLEKSSLSGCRGVTLLLPLKFFENVILDMEPFDVCKSALNNWIDNDPEMNGLTFEIDPAEKLDTKKNLCLRITFRY